MENNLQEVINNETVEQVCEGATKSNGGWKGFVAGAVIGFVATKTLPAIGRGVKNLFKKFNNKEVETEEIIDDEQSEE